jgi:hypothetical protein
MPFGYTNAATDWPTSEPMTVRVWRRILCFMPKSNPDNEPLYPLVRRWALEIDVHGKPIREVGLDERGTFLFRAPHGRNYGMWTDSPVTIAHSELEPMNERQFQELWAQGDKRVA